MNGRIGQAIIAWCQLCLPQETPRHYPRFHATTPDFFPDTCFPFFPCRLRFENGALRTSGGTVCALAGGLLGPALAGASEQARPMASRPMAQPGARDLFLAAPACVGRPLCEGAQLVPSGKCRGWGG